ncbi:restriction endonuclease subunit S [Streptococcus salivarius]
MTKKPSYRFVGYIEPWEQKKLGEVAEVNPKSVVPDEFKYVDLGSVVGTEMVSYRNETISTSPSRAQRLAIKGDVFYQTVRPYQKNNYLFKKDDDDYVFSTGYAQLRPSGDGCFLLSYLQTNKFVNVVLDNCTGTSYPAINSKDLSDIFISLPSLPEQTAIGSFFQDIDQLINLQQRKLEVLKEQKKTYLKLLFPAKGQTKPALRFAGFEDDWKEVKLGEVLTERNIQMVPSEQVPLVSFTVENGVTPKTERYNREFLVREDFKKYKYTRYNDIVYNPANLKFGAIARNKYGEAVFSPIYVTFEVNYSNILPEFIEGILTSKDFIQQALKFQEGTVYERMAVKADDFTRLAITVPSLPEQEVIGSFFQDLDTAIAKQEGKVNQLKESKQTLLRKMFI